MNEIKTKDVSLGTILEAIQHLGAQMEGMKKELKDDMLHMERRLKDQLASKEDIARVEERITEQQLRIDDLESQEFVLKLVRQSKSEKNPPK